MGWHFFVAYSNPGVVLQGTVIAAVKERKK